MVRQYLLGEREPMTALIGVELRRDPPPVSRMHSEYLRRLFLANDLAQGRYLAAGRPVSLTDIRAPVFLVGTEADHISPWRSVYKLTMLADSDVTFLLTAGGHNAGIVSPPGHPRRSYRIATHREGERLLDPDTWLQSTPVRTGSWWPAWQRWLADRSAPPGPPRPSARREPDTRLSAPRREPTSTSVDRRADAYMPIASRFHASGQCCEPDGTCSSMYSGAPSAGRMR